MHCAPWLLYEIFTVNAVGLAALDAERAVVVFSTLTGLAAVATFFATAHPGEDGNLTQLLRRDPRSHLS